MALDQLVQSLNDLYRLSGSPRVHADTVRVTGVSITQTGLRFLSLIEDSPRISASDLAASADVSQPTASRVLQTLENDGYVVRHQSDRDGRVSHYVASPAGKKALAKVHQYHLERLAFALADVDEARKQEIVGVVDELVTRFHRTAYGTRRTA
ncbi:MAG: transcriptional regulator, MarR family [Frankiales bacterium]|jgi:DNA-binding MarR family transcriptional regulator|nr:transcriptional regulator, MarR family [Frankiales bacterium]